MLGIRSAWRPDGSYSPAEAVYGAQPVLLGQYLGQPEPPAAPFLDELQEVLSGRPPRATTHHSQPGPPELPDDLLHTRFVLVRRDAVQPPLQPLYDGPYLVLERSLRFFKLQLGNKTDVVSTSRLKACQAQPDTAAAVPPRRGRPPILRRPDAPPPLPKRRQKVRLSMRPEIIRLPALDRPVRDRRRPDRFSPS